MRIPVKPDAISVMPNKNGRKEETKSNVMDTEEMPMPTSSTSVSGVTRQTVVMDVEETKILFNESSIGRQCCA